MATKLIIIADPGIDTAFAIALAMHDPALELIGLLPSAGNVSAQQATLNVNVLIDELNPPRWPRTGSAIPVEYELDGTAMHGADGLGQSNFTARTKHHSHPADKVLCDLVYDHPNQVCVAILGPSTTFARALDRDPALARLIDKLVIVGGCWKEPGNAGPAAEFHFYLDPDSTRRCLHVGLHPIIVPLDITRKLILSPSELLELPNPESTVCQFLRQIVPFGIRASMNLYGIEGFHLKDVLGIALISKPEYFTMESRIADVETRGDITRGMFVVDARKTPVGLPNVEIATDCNIAEVRNYFTHILREAP